MVPASNACQKELIDSGPYSQLKTTIITPFIIIRNKPIVYVISGRVKITNSGFIRLFKRAKRSPAIKNFKKLPFKVTIPTNDAAHKPIVFPDHLSKKPKACFFMLLNYNTTAPFLVISTSSSIRTPKPCFLLYRPGSTVITMFSDSGFL